MFYGKLVVVRVLTSQWGFTKPSSICISLGKVRDMVPLVILPWIGTSGGHIKILNRLPTDGPTGDRLTDGPIDTASSGPRVKIFSLNPTQKQNAYH